jgi:brefeldin A-inhibited guanine nucleotide-exchange protein
MGLSEHQLKRQGLECLVAVLRSLVAWGTSSTGKSAAESAADAGLRSQGEDTRQETVTPDASVDRVSFSANSVETLRQPTPDVADDPSRFESAKQKKTTLLEGIKKFNFKPKRVGGAVILVEVYTDGILQGVQFLIETGFIPSKDPSTIAYFLLTTDGLSKAMIGEYLGEASVVTLWIW